MQALLSTLAKAEPLTAPPFLSTPTLLTLLWCRCRRSGTALEYFLCPLNGEICAADQPPLWVLSRAGVVDSAESPVLWECFDRAQWLVDFLRQAPAHHSSPAETHDNAEAERERLVEEAADAGGGCSWDLRSWLSAAFEQEDADGSGEMDAPFFWEVAARLCAQLGLGPAELEALRVRGQLAHNEVGLSVDWSEFTMLCTDALRGMVRLQRQNVPSKEDWCCLANPEPAESDAEEPIPPFWFNKRTGAAQWECPFLDTL